MILLNNVKFNSNLEEDLIFFVDQVKIYFSN